MKVGALALHRKQTQDTKPKRTKITLKLQDKQFCWKQKLNKESLNPTRKLVIVG